MTSTDKPNTVGATGATVAQNIRRLRNARSLSTYELAEKIAKAGRPMSPGKITRVEAQKTRVDTDDLMAFAVALNVSPTALLLPPTATGTVEITGAGKTPAHDAWRWADGQWPLRFSRNPEELRRQLLDHGLYSRPEGIPPYQELEAAVRWMKDFSETPFEHQGVAPTEKRNPPHGEGLDL